MKIALVTAIAALAFGIGPAFAADSNTSASRGATPLAHARLQHPDVGSEAMPDFGPYYPSAPTSATASVAAGQSATSGQSGSSTTDD